MMENKFKFLPHTSEIKFKAWGKTLNEAFENSVLAFAEFVANENKLKASKGKVVTISGDDRESLLYNFLEELISLIDSEEFVVVKATVTLRGNNLLAEIYGDDASNYKGIQNVKAPTYSEMYVKQTSKGWEVQVVLDV
mgnify:CR=1 FL=1